MEGCDVWFIRSIVIFHFLFFGKKKKRQKERKKKQNTHTHTHTHTQADGVENVVSIEQAIQSQNFPTAGVSVLVGSNLDEGSTFMCVHHNAGTSYCAPD